MKGRWEFGGLRGRLRRNLRIGSRGRIVVDVVGRRLVVLKWDSVFFGVVWYKL